MRECSSQKLRRHRHSLPHEGFVPTAADEARAQLTWKGRFKDVTGNRGVEVYNYYSAGSGSESGDEVLELSPSTPSPITGMLDSLGRYAWHKQEAYKGRVAKTVGIIMMNHGLGLREKPKGRNS